MEQSGQASNSHSATESAIGHEEISKVRSLIRKKRYLLQPVESEVHHSVDNDILTADLVNFSVLASEMQHSYMEEFLSNIKDGGSVKECNAQDHKMIYVTQKEKQQLEAIENLPISNITQRIFHLREKLGPEESSLFEEIFNKTVKGKRKSLYIEFITELEEHIESFMESCDGDILDD